ncbi:MAG: hypothetical protein R3B72_36295 [Polyangiaceae bacterium]
MGGLLLTLVVLLTWSGPQPSSLAASLVGSLGLASQVGEDAFGPSAHDAEQLPESPIVAELEEAAEELEPEEDSAGRRALDAAPSISAPRFALAWRQGAVLESRAGSEPSDLPRARPAQLDRGCVSSRGPPQA